MKRAIRYGALLLAFAMLLAVGVNAADRFVSIDSDGPDTTNIPVDSTVYDTLGPFESNKLDLKRTEVWLLFDNISGTYGDYMTLWWERISTSNSLPQPYLYPIYADTNTADTTGPDWVNVSIDSTWLPADSTWYRCVLFDPSYPDYPYPIIEEARQGGGFRIRVGYISNAADTVRVTSKAVFETFP